MIIPTHNETAAIGAGIAADADVPLAARG